MKRWIVNAAKRSVRDEARGPFAKGISASDALDLKPGEFFWNGTYADAMAAGARRLLAEALLKDEYVKSNYGDHVFAIVADRIEPNISDGIRCAELSGSLHDIGTAVGYDVWREGTGLVVLSRLP